MAAIGAVDFWCATPCTYNSLKKRKSFSHSFPIQLMDPFLGEIRAVGFNFAPQGWALCQGQLLPVAQNTALFSLLGTTYGGNGRTTFSLPDLRGRLIVSPGHGPGLSNYSLGQVSGTETVGLLSSQLPAHIHGLTGVVVRVSSNSANVASPAGTILAATEDLHYSSGSGTQMGSSAITGTAQPVGGNTGHTNLMPYLALNYIIALQGIFPPRS
jgi:microcystin-dependent protein